MNKKLLAISMALSLAVLSTIGSAWAANNASDAKVEKQQLLLMPSAQKTVADATGYEPKNIKIEPTAHRITITVFDNTLNSGVSRDREPEATQMASSLERVISRKAEFAQVVIIHVDYVESLGSKKSVEAYEFYKTPASVFVIHKS